MIYIVTHKPVALPTLKGYRPIQVGGAAAIPGMLRDDTGDSIASMNPSYCELTAVYWIWKNARDEYKGLAHYRRYFGRKRFSSDPRDILDEPALKGMLDGCDILLARPAVYHVNAREQLLMDCCDAATLDRLDAVFESRHPGDMDAYRAFFRQNRAAQYNMLYCKAELFDAYCAWLFPVLFELEDYVDLTGADDYRRRLYGFLSERLLNVWVSARGLRVKYLPVVSTEYTFKDHLTYRRRDITNGMRFALRGKK